MTENKKPETVMSVNDEGDIVATTVYYGTDVVVPHNGEEIVIAKQEDYKVLQITPVKNIPTLYEYLKNQLLGMEKNRDKGLKELDKLKDVDSDSILEALKGINPENIKKSKKMTAVNKLLEDAEMKKRLKDNIEILEINIAKVKEQHDFVEKQLKQ